MGLFNSDETDRALRAIQHNLSYLSLPLAVVLLPTLSTKQRNSVFTMFILIVIASTIPVFYKYFLNFAEINQSLGMGKAIPTPIDHVRYSIFLSIAFVFSCILFITKKDFIGKYLKYAFLGTAVYLFIAVHVLAVRSGIGLSYLGLLMAGSLLLYQSKKYYIMAFLWLVIIISPVFAYYAIPSFQNKIKYTRYDLSLSQADKGANYSDSERIRSFKIGIDIWKDYKMIGIGTGDLKREMGNRYEEKYTQGGRAFLPHNQVIKILASSGILGLLLFAISFYGPFLWNQNFRDPFILALVSMLTVSFLVEATLERSYMLALYLLLASLLYKKSIS
ncbi:hypothetical protein GCM10007940_27690 [Portibacter lacus]|uniref:O-antigen ligase-related domain-containing protein n=2 Tax=Portibacter lacus TaxID=1099794 RepID=A0AA37SR26_9BACT|nr:hypothetical protein GCM10007940_27690 [Portibacter lacus]